MLHRLFRWSAAAVVVVGAMCGCGDANGATTCATAFRERAEGDGLRSARPAAEAKYRPLITTGRGFAELYEQVFEQARAFPGDRDVLKLRWAAAHSTTRNHSRLGPVANGAVLVAGATDENGTDENGVVKGGRVGALRVSDGKLLWNRSGALGATSEASDGVSVALAEGPDGGFMMEDGPPRPRTAGLDLRTGRRLWCTSAADPSAMPYWLSPAAPRVAAGIFFADEGRAGTLKAIRSADRGVLWSAAAPKGSNYRELVAGEGMAAVATEPASPYSGGGPSELAGYRMSDGAKLWRKGDSAGLGRPGHTDHRPVAIGKGSVVVVETSFSRSAPKGETRVAAYRATDGRLRWSRPVPETTSSDQVDVVGSRVVVAAANQATAFNLTNGRTTWTHNTDDRPQVRDAAVHGPYLYAPQKDGPGLAVLDLERGTTRTTLNFLKDPSYDVTATDGVLLIQYANLTLAFNLPPKNQP
ncbi:PQQ-binding-like beta-propeller repeat protein [Actinomadura sp. 9N215]|uniref:outer membrane protein assembly factor BamB family protein n=1 Tax=Actinomadura sp. 9N215 TaxID=3375150 RepID=UPI0037B2F060